MSGIRDGRISPSAINRWLQCPKQYRLHDLERQRPEQTPSPLLARPLRAAFAQAPTCRAFTRRRGQTVRGASRLAVARASIRA
jgi:hypothetical protein